MTDRHIIITVERPDGTTYEQSIQLLNGEEPLMAMRRFQNAILGDPYRWYTTKTGERKCCIKRNAYLAINWRWL